MQLTGRFLNIGTFKIQAFNCIQKLFIRSEIDHLGFAGSDGFIGGNTDQCAQRTGA